MSTITVTNIKATGETASRSATGVAAAWVHFTGTGTVAINDSINTSSITDTDVGRYSMNFSNNLGNANYSGSGLSGNDGATTTGRSINIDATPTTSAFAVRGVTSSGNADSLTDDTNMLYTFHGDLA